MLTIQPMAVWHLSRTKVIPSQTKSDFIPSKVLRLRLCVWSLRVDKQLVVVVVGVSKSETIETIDVKAKWNEIHGSVKQQQKKKNGTRFY